MICFDNKMDGRVNRIEGGGGPPRHELTRADDRGGGGGTERFVILRFFWVKMNLRTGSKKGGAGTCDRITSDMLLVFSSPWV